MKLKGSKILALAASQSGGYFIRQALDDEGALGQWTVLVGGKAATEFDEVEHRNFGLRDAW